MRYQYFCTEAIIISNFCASAVQIWPKKTQINNHRLSKYVFIENSPDINNLVAHCLIVLKFDAPVPTSLSEL